ncbi:UDP-N-acetylmuramoyl-L-alanyl-D-glutamate--2,6-diaminopimelate ligase [Desulfurivibrio alkaliphilus]|uniref:UDP-N-acetylmuramoyl-L-alanyl-D-glutamate--2,6-diaminopimelate ligase n=1 Tax=Desulfurivibrio alkaliphilus (strain DSM 19089 / UNIQEM U267 / AHT2) TaxID=589865 RepID=D6Z3Q5_DESAT|nr:UDP-N-acetylmuramoyl-L-alanyl-D-glutamate--2,6-diaminopimelate ligase [Desulfurivibrio alkaliphilus]ADH86180.1 UDP-N-acetylmuramyl-tripeptide synthetase [Desulfurivibrio alkaliphilus AHT 2]
MKVRQLIKAAAVDYTVLAEGASAELEVTTVTADSRRAGPGSLFVALPGSRVDGHDFLAAAVKQGCRVVLCQPGCRLPTEKAPEVLHLATADTRAAFGRLCAALRGFPAQEMVMIGITGTNGKTTASYLLEDLIRRAGGEPGVIGTVNYRYRNRVLPATHTTPDPESLQPLLREMAEAGVSHVIMEVSSHALEQQRVAGIAFDAALFTNLSHEHLDYHGDMESYFAGKKLLFNRYLKPGAAAVVLSGRAEQDDASLDCWNQRLIDELSPRVLPPGCRRRPKAGEVRLWRCGAAGNELRLLRRRLSLAGIEAELQSSEGAWRLSSTLVGDFNLDNLLGVAGVGLALGMTPATIAAALADAAPPPGRLERFRSRRGVEVLVDYAHTPDALGHVLKALRRLATGRLVVVFGCGGDRDRAKRPLMGEVAAALADIVVLTSDNPRSEAPAAIMADIQRGLATVDARRGRLESLLAAPLNRRTTCQGYDLVVSRRQAIRDTIYHARSGDVVLVCGKGHETSQIIAGSCLDFDDRREVREQLAVLATTG